jgi:putative zinc finger/helix-turn-helix YgiT family protein
MPNCPQCNTPLQPRKVQKTLRFRERDVTVPAQVLACPDCGFQASSVQQAGKLQRAVADAYRVQEGLLPGSEIKRLREEKGWSQDELAKRMHCGIASIKRWEGGCVQSAAMDSSLRRILAGNPQSMGADACSGGRELSLSRIKLVLLEFGKHLGRDTLKRGDKFLYVAKYLWYADMLAYRELGRSMTGAHYAALPQGPQLNNYKELVDPIRQSNEEEAEPLSSAEREIVSRVAESFPKIYDAYKASHDEALWQRLSTGSLIPYSLASEIELVR